MDEEIKKTDECIPCKEAEEKSMSQKLKEENDMLEAELLRKQKIRNEALLSGTSGGAIPKEEPKEETAKEYAERFEKGELKLE